MSVRYLLDTNAASYLINKKSPAMERHLARVAVAELGISAVTEGELRNGVASRGSAPLQAAAKEYRRLRAELERAGRLLRSLDMMIAAHAWRSGRRWLRQIDP